jgi:hypothetical protein
MEIKIFRNIIMGSAVVLCIFFFTLPLVQCSQDSSLTASGWEIATGTGKLYGEADESGNPLVFSLLIIPAILLTLTLMNKPFVVLRNVSIAGLAAKIIFLIGTYMQLNSEDYKGALVLTAFNWLILAAYIGLCVFTHYCKKLE